MTQFATYADLLNAITDENGRDILNPATGEVVGRAPENTVEDLNAAVETARAAQKDFAKLSDEERCELLTKAAAAVEANAEALVELLSREQGKPLNGPNARFEVGACSAWLNATASFEHPNYTAVDDDITATVNYRPLGVVGAIGPWNWPMMITIWQIAPALRMGNAVVVKPSEYTPLSVLGLLKVVNSVLPEGILQVVSGAGEVGAALTTHEGVDKIMFTGSTATGKKIVEASADNLTRLTLELGGNDAGIVLDDADPKEIAGDLFWGAFINTGQTCAAMKRVYVPESLYDAVCEALIEVAKASPMGVGLEEENVLGPLQNKQQFDIVDKLVNAAKDSGARVLLGGDPDYDAPGYFYPTTLVADIDPDNPLVVEEQFGPALPIIKYTDLDWAIEQANKLDVGLGSSVWSSNRERALEVAAQLEAGTTWINSHGAVDPRVPFGGIKSSGYGVEFGTEGLKGLAYPQIING
ncbi:aldehyde dehydrogenase [Corynebacterium sp. HMSC056F09]|uniref:aldehyde dehydrogenase family protein n=1 Tax=unclassified Corynebacterium TaxID=2624378 RepID=UPI0008A1FD70|nr:MULTISPECIES: aldehyde dehydrogenase family protein [unclassified Corynebacterium]OFK65402.1 aldehyde dehydrogenase [Corynebacterium sp. HMSC074A09]OFN38349.1 aldehyde dehydrogenase [Corynebacterium sp. HMSC072A04]OFO19353.1 aldehyde dehydrogenase [Corynebacterium sp. HMSC056F09]OFQ55495.1 aldehyde dehydrogenase [Corynebacterium sp. HMSC074H12]